MVRFGGGTGRSNQGVGKVARSARVRRRGRVVRRQTLYLLFGQFGDEPLPSTSPAPEYPRDAGAIRTADSRTDSSPDARRRRGRTRVWPELADHPAALPSASAGGELVSQRHDIRPRPSARRSRTFTTAVDFRRACRGPPRTPRVPLPRETSRSTPRRRRRQRHLLRPSWNRQPQLLLSRSTSSHQPQDLLHRGIRLASAPQRIRCPGHIRPWIPASRWPVQPLETPSRQTALSACASTLTPPARLAPGGRGPTSRPWKHRRERVPPFRLPSSGAVQLE